MASVKARVAFRRWLYWQQQGLCYLGITLACQQRARRMYVDVAHWGVKAKGAFATFEHVVARSKKARNAQTLLLLACRHCNSKKNDADPLPEHVALAEEMRAKWGGGALPPKLSARARKRYQQQQQLHEHQAKLRREALGLNVLGNAQEREKKIKALRNAVGHTWTHYR